MIAVKENCKIDDSESIYDDILYWQNNWLVNNIGQQGTEALKFRLRMDADVLNVLKDLRTSKSARPENVSAVFRKDSTFPFLFTFGAYISTCTA